MTDTPELLPCPFCGDDGMSYGWSAPGIRGGASDGHVECMECGALVIAEPAERDAIAAWNRRTTTPPTDDEREGLARAMCLSGGYDPDERMPNDGPRWRYYVPGADAALAYLAPIRAREIAAAEARGVEMERARVVAWLPPVWFSTDYNWRQAKSAIERGEHTKGDEA